MQGMRPHGGGVRNTVAHPLSVASRVATSAPSAFVASAADSHLPSLTRGTHCARSCVGVAAEAHSSDSSAQTTREARQIARRLMPAPAPAPAAPQRT